MSVSFIVGKPGGGKSMLAARIVIKELVTTDRYVVTNVPLKVKRVIEYCLAKYGAHINPARIRILTEDETKQFFLHRAGDHKAKMPADGTNGVVDYTQLTAPDGEKRDNCDLLPVLYVVDEAHLHFGARDWAKTGKAAMWYLSQHRHFGDNVVFVTQSWKNVDSAFRRLAQDFTVCVNLSKRKAFGFKLPSLFMLRTYDQEPTPYATEVSTETHRLDVDGLASCYDTAAGVGITTGLADTRDKPKGLPWQLGFALFLLLLASILAVPYLMAEGSKKVLGIDAPATNSLPKLVVTNSPALATNNPAPPVAVPVSRLVPPPPTMRQVQPGGPVVVADTPGARLVALPQIEAEKPVKVRFFIRRGDQVMLGLDNGDVFTVGDGRLQIAGKLAILDGNRAYRLPE